MADSRNEDLLENMLGGSNEYGEPQSRNEAILQNILGEQNELLPPVSRIETLLLQLKDAMPSGEIEITENGEYDVTAYETATVNVAGGGGGVEITDITLNADGTYTVTDADNNTHTLTVTETDGQITSVTYDGNVIPLSFDASGILTSVGNTEVDVSNYLLLFLLHFNNSIENSQNIPNIESQGVIYDSNGKFGECVEKGASTRLAFQSEYFKKTSAESKTVEFWAKFPANMSGGIPVLIYANGFSIYIATDKAYLLNGSRNSIVVNHGVNADEWAHYAYVLTDSGNRLYVNGTLIGNSADIITATSNTAYILCEPTLVGTGIGGFVDEFAMFNYAKYTSNFTPPTQPY